MTKLFCLSAAALCALQVTQAGAQASAQATPAPSVKFNGDFRVRYEYTSTGNGSLQLSREVVRLRAGLTYPLREDVTVRARLATGDPDDPNSTDVTLSSFVNDFAVSLDIASVEVSRPHWGATAGKFTNPFQYTELVWDGDVNPQGVSGRLILGDRAKVSGTLTGLYFIVDQQVNNLSSDMAGGQLAVNAPSGQWRVTGALGYYNYNIRSLSAAGSGDTRTNRLNAGGTGYLSDFEMLDLLFAVDYAGMGEKYPLRVVGDYVHNSGAADLNTGWEADLYLGKAARKGDLRYRYGYGVAETDAVLAAFSHDNTTIGTNYEMHTLAFDGLPFNGLLLNATLYYYRPHQVAAGVTRVYQKRLRLNATVNF